MSSSRPRPIRTLPNLAAQPFRPPILLHDLRHEPQTLQATGGGREKKFVDGLSRRHANIPHLRAETRTQVPCVFPHLDVRKEKVVTLFRAGRSLSPASFARGDCRP